GAPNCAVNLADSEKPSVVVPRQVPLQVAPGPPLSCGFSPDGKLMACAYGVNEVGQVTLHSGNILIWDTRTGQAVKGLSSAGAAYTYPFFRTDGTVLALGQTSGGNRVLAPGWGASTLWDASN